MASYSFQGFAAHDADKKPFRSGLYELQCDMPMATLSKKANFKLIPPTDDKRRRKAQKEDKVLFWPRLRGVRTGMCFLVVATQYGGRATLGLEPLYGHSETLWSHEGPLAFAYVCTVAPGLRPFVPSSVRECFYGEPTDASPEEEVLEALVRSGRLTLAQIVEQHVQARLSALVPRVTVVRPAVGLTRA